MEKAKRPLPPELQFLNDLARINDLSLEELLAWMPKHLERIRLHADLLRRHGFDPDHMIGLVQPSWERLQAAQAEVERTQDALLNATANQAAAARTLVDNFEAAVTEVKATQPFHPDLPEWEDLLEQLREQYPKLDDD